MGGTLQELDDAGRDVPGRDAEGPDEPATPRDAEGPDRPLDAPRWRRALLAARPLLFAAWTFLVVLAIGALVARLDVDPFSPLTPYGLRVAAVVVAVAVVGATWLAHRNGETWDSDLVPALFAGLGALTIVVILNGTPYDTQGLFIDNTFRTEMVTRFADSWHLSDYTYRGLPAYYAPLLFWTLGRAAALTGSEPFTMLKYGAVGLSFLLPLVSYLLWRRVVPARVAALLSAGPLVLPVIGENYAWLVQWTFLPWWLAVGHAVGRRAIRRPAVIGLGVVGAALFLTYYYYLYLIPIALGVHLLVTMWMREPLPWRQLRTTVAVGAVAAALSAPFWAQLLWRSVTASAFESLNNRWMPADGGRLVLPMLEPSAVGMLCLVGFVYLILTAREALSRSMLVVLASTYVWHLLGYLAALADRPILPFRMTDLVPVILVSAAALALARVPRLVSGRLGGDAALRIALAGGLVLAVFAGDRYVSAAFEPDVLNHGHDTTLPDGKLPKFAPQDTKAVAGAPARIREFIDASYDGTGHPVVLTDRSDLLSLYPYYGFVQWDAHFSNPMGRYRDRVAFVQQLATSATPREFVARVDRNPFDRIDVVVLYLSQDQQTLTFSTADDSFPYGTAFRSVSIPRSLVSPDDFTLLELEGCLVAVRKTGR